MAMGLVWEKDKRGLTPLLLNGEELLLQIKFTLGTVYYLLNGRDMTVRQTQCDCIKTPQMLETGINV